MLRKLILPITLCILILSGNAAGAGTTPPGKAGITRPGVYTVDYLRPSTQLDPRAFPVDGQLGFWLWSELNPRRGGYDWDETGARSLDGWIRKQSGLGLRPSIMISTYDTSTGNDIRSTPNWVIKLPDAVLPVTLTNGLPHFIDYFHRKSARQLNGEFDMGANWWTISNTKAIAVTRSIPADSHVSETPTRPDRPSKAPALMLGGTDKVNATIVHDAEPVPAMPPELAGRRNAFVSARVNIVSSDPGPNDHLYMEVWDAAGNRLGGTEVDNLANAGQPASFWRVVELDITPFALERAVRVAFRVTTDAANPTTFYVDNVQLRVRHLIPKYWGSAYFKAYKDFIAALGARYRQTPAGGAPQDDLEFVAMGTGVYGESQPAQDTKEWEYGTTFDHVIKAAGMDTTEKWRAWVNEVTATYAAAFAPASGARPLKPLLLQYAPFFLDMAELGYTTDYAAEIGVGASHNRLIPEWTLLYRNNKAGAYDPIRRHWQDVPTAFEGVSSDIGCSPVLSYWAIAGAVARHTDYLRLDSWLLSADGVTPTAHVPAVEWARPFLGKTAADAPAAWTILREQRNPFMLRCGMSYYVTSAASPPWAEYGNFSYFLTQDDTIPGGRTVAETNDKGADRRYARDPSTGNPYLDAGMGNCPTKPVSAMYAANPPACNPQPYNPDLPALQGQNPNDYRDFYNAYDWTGGGKEAFVVRRTDQAAAGGSGGNPFMFFRVDDEYAAPGETVGARFTVGYFDIGTDRWALKYQSPAGERAAGTVTKTGTKSYTQVSFTVPDARFANGLTGGADFYLDSRSSDGANDGNEWVHIVQVERLVAPELTPTPTSTPTPSPTPTETPAITATPTRSRPPVFLPVLLR